jgi:hypothetical protein
MRMLTIEAASVQAARGLCDALSAFGAQIVEGGVRLMLGDGQQTAAALSAIQAYVMEREWTNTARIELDGRSYVLHAH